MLGGKTPFFFVEALGTGYGVLESLPHRDLLILVFIGSRTLEGFEKVIVKNDVIPFLTAARRGHDDPIFPREFLDCGAAGGSCRNNHDAPCREGGQELVVVLCRIVRPGDIELVNAVIAAPVTDKEEEK